MALAAGTRLGPYEIESALGAGGMGEVYRARDPRLGREVAIKVLPEVASADPERLRRFEQEARAAAALNHPNILAVHDIGIHDGWTYIVSELLDGGTLRAAMGGGLPVRKAVDYAIQIARGLSAAHDRGIVHRDLKPDNVFVTSAGHVKILDFGLAKLVEVLFAPAGVTQAPTTPPGTEPGLVLGTVGYMAPEQLRGQTVDHRADLFALGALLYEMLSGQRAFPGVTGAEAIAAILDREPAELPMAERRIPPGLARIVERCLEKNPEARFRTAADLAFALEALSASAASSEAAAAAAVGRSLLPSTRRTVLVAGVSSLAALLSGVAMTLYMRPAPEPIVTRLDVVTPPTSDPFSFAVSPDGRRVVFVADGEKGPQLWLRALDQATAQPLVGTEGASAPFWAPDGRAVGFFADSKLKRLDFGGGAVQVVTGATAGRGGTWNGDDLIVFAPTANGGLLRVLATGGVTEPVTQLATGQGSHRWPQFLPDGRRFLFFVGLGQVGTRGVYIASLDGGEPRRLLVADTSAVAASGRLLYVSQGGVLVAQTFDSETASIGSPTVPVAQGVGTDPGVLRGGFSFAGDVLAYRAGAPVEQRQLLWADRTGKVVSRLGPPDDTQPASPSVAPDGRRVAVGRFPATVNPDVWIFDASRGVASRFTFDDGIDLNPLWSPDGTRIVFRSGRNGAFDLFQKPASGAGQEQPLLVTSQSKSPLDWSRDGRFLLYAVQDEKSGTDLWALPLTGDRKPFVILQTSFDEMQGQFSPDGQWLAYASNESGRFEVYVRPFPDAGGIWQVSTGGGTQPRWGLNGQELLYVAPDGQLMAASIRVIAGAVDASQPVALFRVRLASGGNVVPAGYNSSAQYVVARDGRLLMNVAVDGAPTSPITLVLNWAATLNR